VKVFDLLLPFFFNKDFVLDFLILLIFFLFLDDEMFYPFLIAKRLFLLDLIGNLFFFFFHFKGLSTLTNNSGYLNGLSLS